jgi:hypothetical protein
VLDESADAQLVQRVLASQDNMLDQMGIYQHHDAATGTARQDVANDYNNRLAGAMLQNNQVYAELMNYRLDKTGKMSSDSTWKFCETTNSTYLDCPIAGMNLTQGKEIFVNVHNPHVGAVKNAQISVPNGHFKLSILELNLWLDISDKIDVNCNNDTAYNKSSMVNCHLQFPLDPSNSQNVFKMVYDTSFDATSPSSEAVVNQDIVETDQMMMQLVEVSKTESRVKFEITDKQTNATERFTFDLSYWPSYCNYHKGSNSGAYAFRQIDHLFHPLTYSEIKSIEYLRGKTYQKFVIYFETAHYKTGEPMMKAIAHVSLDSDL